MENIYIKETAVSVGGDIIWIFLVKVLSLVSGWREGAYGLTFTQLRSYPADGAYFTVAALSFSNGFSDKDEPAFSGKDKTDLSIFIKKQDFSFLSYCKEV